jgi:hypothetical protein
MTDIFETDQPRRNLNGVLWTEHLSRCEAAGVCAWAMLREQVIKCDSTCLTTCKTWPAVGQPKNVHLNSVDNIRVAWNKPNG